MTRRRWDRTDLYIALITIGILAWCGGWAWVACHFIWKWW